MSDPSPSPYYSYPVLVREHPKGTTVLVLGILGLVLCGILGPIAWSKGNAAKREMDMYPHVVWTNRGEVTAGRICGMVSTIILCVQIAIFVLFMLLFVIVASGD